MKSINYIVLLSVVLIFSCGSSSENSFEVAESASTENDNHSKVQMNANVSSDGFDFSPEPDEQNGYISSSAARVNKDSTKKFVRTANLKFRVENVYYSTKILEEITSQYEGFVTYTNLVSLINRRSLDAVSADSSLESLFFTVENNLEIRVPNDVLEKVLKKMSSEIDYLDFRVIKAEEVTFNLIANEMKKKRMEEHSKTIKKELNKKKTNTTVILSDATGMTSSLLNTLENKDDAILSSLQIQDKIDYSTIKLLIYQRQEVKRAVIANQKNVDVYQPGFFYQWGEAIITGWNILKSIILGLFKIWPILLILIGGFVGYRLFVNKER